MNPGSVASQLFDLEQDGQVVRTSLSSFIRKKKRERLKYYIPDQLIRKVKFINLSMHAMHTKSFQSCQTLCNSIDYSLPGSSVKSWNSPGKDIRVCCHFLLQGIIPTQGSNPHLLSFLYW